MAGFGDVSTAAGLEALNAYLASKSYVEGYSFSPADSAVFSQLSGIPSKSTYPYAYRWSLHISALIGVRSVPFLAAPASAAAPVPTKVPKVTVAPKAAPVSAPAPEIEEPSAEPVDEVKEDAEPEAEAAEETKTAAKADDDMDDLFGDDDEDEAPAPKVSMADKVAKMKEEKAKNKKVDRSQVLFEVKPFDTEIDLNELYTKITQIQFEGLTWGEGYELKPVAYGICKLVMSCVIVDDIVAIDDIFDPIEAMEDEVQSVDMLTMNRL